MIEALLTITGGSASIPKGVWSALASDSVARYDHAMAHYAGELFVFGGRGSVILNTIRKYTIANGTWSAVSTVLPVARQGFTATTIGSKIYLYGGLNGSTKYGDLYAYDPVANTLTTLASGLACNGHSAVTYEGDLYVYGGQPTNATTTPVNTLRKYTVATNTWSTVTTLGVTPTGRFYAAAGLSDGKFYIAGGSSGSSNVVAGMDVYDFATNTWETPIAIPTTGLAFGSVGTSGRIYSVAGSTGNPTPTVYFSTTRVYDTVTGEWNTVSPYPIALGYNAVCIVGDTVYSFGGYNPTAIQPLLYRFVP